MTLSNRQRRQAYRQTPTTPRHQPRTPKSPAETIKPQRDGLDRLISKGRLTRFAKTVALTYRARCLEVEGGGIHLASALTALVAVDGGRPFAALPRIASVIDAQAWLHEAWTSALHGDEETITLLNDVCHRGKTCNDLSRKPDGKEDDRATRRREERLVMALEMIGRYFEAKKRLQHATPSPP